MSASREELLAILETVYRRGAVWGEPVRADDRTVRVSDSGGVTWIAMAILPEDLLEVALRDRLLTLSSQRMPEPDGRRCVLELLPAEECAEDVLALLRELRLDEIVGVYSRAA